MSDLEQIVDGVEPEQATPEPTPEPEAAAPETTETPEEPKPEAPAMVPVGVVQELRQEIRELKSLAAPKPEAPKPPEFLDPEGAEFLGREIATMRGQMAAELSRTKAELVHGAEAVQEAWQAAEQANMIDTLGNQPDAWNKLVDWHKQAKVAQEIGNDPTAFRQKVEAEMRAKIEAEMVAKQAKAAAGQPAPSMANVTGTGGGPRTTWTGPTDLTGLIGE